MHDDTPALRFVERGPGAERDRFDWFRDEVAVDFPSLGAAADRMRAAFLATEEARRPLAAEVRISAGEARAGRRVPVCLALPRTCATCGGRGEVWNEPCPRCAGSGDDVWPHQVHVHLPSGVRDGARFLFSVSPPHAPAVVVDLRVSVAWK
jgi:hypothetical protein